MAGRFTNLAFAANLPNVSGAPVTRTMPARLSDAINVIDYGADNTGTRGCGAAIQRAFDAALGPQSNPNTTLEITSNPYKNKRIFFPAGKYLVDQQLFAFGYGVCICGEGKNVTRLVYTGPNSQLPTPIPAQGLGTTVPCTPMLCAQSWYSSSVRGITFDCGTSQGGSGNANVCVSYTCFFVAVTASIDNAGVMTVTALTDPSPGKIFTGMRVVWGAAASAPFISGYISGSGGVGTYQTNYIGAGAVTSQQMWAYVASDGSLNMWTDCGFVGGFDGFIDGAGCQQQGDITTFVNCLFDSNFWAFTNINGNGLCFNFIACEISNNSDRAIRNVGSGGGLSFFGTRFHNNGVVDILQGGGQAVVAVGCYSDSRSFLCASPVYVSGCEHNSASNGYFWDGTLAGAPAPQDVIADSCHSSKGVIYLSRFIYLHGSRFDRTDYLSLINPVTQLKQDI